MQQWFIMPSAVQCLGPNYMCSGLWCRNHLWNISALVLTSIHIPHTLQSGKLFIFDPRDQLMLHHFLFYWIKFTGIKNLETLNLHMLSKFFLVKHYYKLLSGSDFLKWLSNTLLNASLKMHQRVLKYFCPFPSCWYSETGTAIMEFLHFPKYPF